MKTSLTVPEIQLLSEEVLAFIGRRIGKIHAAARLEGDNWPLDETLNFRTGVVGVCATTFITYVPIYIDYGVPGSRYATV